MSSYKINYEQLRQQPEITAMLSALERGFKIFEIDFYLVGAVAKRCMDEGGASTKLYQGEPRGILILQCLLMIKELMNR